MERYKVLLSGTALRFLRRLDSKTIERIKKGLLALEENPFHGRPKADIKQLQGSFDPVLYRIRIGEYRAIYAVSGSEVSVTEIMKRSRGYEWLD